MVDIIDYKILYLLQIFVIVINYENNELMMDDHIDNQIIK